MRQLTVVSSLLFALLGCVLSRAFGSEFMLVAESRWGLTLIFLLILINAQLASLPSSSLPSGTRLGELATTIPVRTLRILWGVVAAAGLLALGYGLVLLLDDSFTGANVLLLAIVATPFAGFAVVLVVDAVRNTRQLIGRGGSGEKPERWPPDSFHLHTILAIAVSLVALRLVTFHPEWSGAVTHQPVFERGDQEGRGYRIPSLLVLPDDRVIAFAESRANVFLDWGDIDLVMRHGIDGGASWGPIETVVDVGDRTAGNPCPVYDRITQTILMPYTIDNETLMLTESRDGGRSGSEPRDLTRFLIW